MTEKKVINVREVLQQNSYTTTVDELRTRGKNRVRVINAQQISALIEEAVNRVISTTSGMDRNQVKQLVERSRDEFRRLLSEREKELAENRQSSAELAKSKEEFAKVQAETDRLKVVEAELRRQNETLTTQVGDLKAAAKNGNSSPRDLEEIGKLQKKEEAAQKEIADLRKQTDSLRQAEAEVRKEESARRKEAEKLRLDLESLQKNQKGGERLQAELSALQKNESDLRRKDEENQKERDRLVRRIGELEKEVEGLKTKGGEKPLQAAMTPEMAELLKSLATEVSSMKAGLKEVADRSQDTTSSSAAQKMDEITKSLTDRLDKIGRKVGISSGADAPEVSLEGIFSQEDNFESNIDNIEIKERKGTGVSGAIEKMRNLRKKK